MELSENILALERYNVWQVLGMSEYFIATALLSDAGESGCRNDGAFVSSNDNLSVETLPKASYVNANINLLSQEHLSTKFS